MAVDSPELTPQTADTSGGIDPEESIERLLRDLRSRRDGLSDREAARRLAVDGPNVLARRNRRTWPSQLGRQLVHPLALLLWLAATMSAVSGSLALAIAIVVVVLVNAAFAFIQERHAENAVEALTAYLPPRTRVIREGTERDLVARDLVAGDVIRVVEGDRVSADCRLLSGAVEMDISMLTGESQPVLRTPARSAPHGPLLEAPDLLFSGTTCTQGEATALVYAAGMRTEIGRIAALSQHLQADESPLERQVKQVARLIAVVAIGMGVAFIPLGTLVGGLSLRDTLTFAIGLLVANVPEGLLPTITLALAVGVRVLAREGALVKRISAVETLGSTSVICTDKTGTLTLNQMRVQRCWTATGTQAVDGPSPSYDEVATRMMAAAAACNTASWSPDPAEQAHGDPTEIALLRGAGDAGLDPDELRSRRQELYHFDVRLRRMSTVDQTDEGLVIHSKGAPEEILPLCSRVADGTTTQTPLDDHERDRLLELVEDWAAEGLRILAVAERSFTSNEHTGMSRGAAESDLTLLGLVAMIDPPRPEVRAAVERCHHAGIRLVVVTGDHGLTARGIARQVGVGNDETPVVTGAELDVMTEADLDHLLERNRELIFARSSPEAKLRIAEALQALGHVVAMTGDGVNDSPALRRADIGVAMGRGGTDVAREASTMVLTDDNFATIVTAVEAGRQVYDNVRKFIIYIFAHATPEVVPFLLYALSGGRIPLPLTVMQILAIDLGTETLPALALGREPAEPGLMDRPPRERGQNVIDGAMLGRAWGLLGGVSTALVLTLFLATLTVGGWRFGDSVSSSPLRNVWQQATTVTFLSIVACQVGTAMAARTHVASLWKVGPLTNPLLLWGIAFEIAFAAALILIPSLGPVFGTVRPQLWQAAALLPMPVIVWGIDELWRWHGRRSA